LFVNANLRKPAFFLEPVEAFADYAATIAKDRFRGPTTFLTQERQTIGCVQ
jgi:hypothetical protein